MIQTVAGASVLALTSPAAQPFTRRRLRTDKGQPLGLRRPPRSRIGCRPRRPAVDRLALESARCRARTTHETNSVVGHRNESPSDRVQVALNSFLGDAKPTTAFAAALPHFFECPEPPHRTSGEPRGDNPTAPGALHASRDGTTLAAFLFRVQDAPSQSFAKDCPRHRPFENRILFTVERAGASSNRPKSTNSRNSVASATIWRRNATPHDTDVGHLGQ
mmetsp:Transcript_4243/g.13575  ORF Transcript_4243/g.13575 Transcript_4243/m.13575 type:complete len:219 (-) Transcript_4243:450-1106(-)